jgi:hypothetical protein
MSADRKPEPCCPKCGGTSGHEHILTEQHLMSGDWGTPAESGDSGVTDHLKASRSLVRCIDCGARFKHAALVAKGLA